MKKGLLAILLIFAVALSACGRRAPAQAQPQKAAPDTSEADRAGAAPADYQALAGDYVFQTEGVSPEHSPTLTLGADKSCRFTVNLLERMGHMDGVYEVRDNTVCITVEKVDFDGVVGADIKDLRFDIGGAGALLYRGTSKDEDQVVGMTNPYDLFQRADIAAQGEPPESGA